MTRAGRFLAFRPRTVREVRTKLRDAGYGDALVDEVVDRLIELRLLDDEAFARAWIKERSRTRGRAGALLVAELAGKGISRELAEATVADTAPDEEGQAVEVASKLLRKVARLPLEQQGLRLQQMLLRRGFSAESSSAGARAVLPPEGWD